MNWRDCHNTNYIGAELTEDTITDSACRQSGHYMLWFYEQDQLLYITIIENVINLVCIKLWVHFLQSR